MNADQELLLEALDGRLSREEDERLSARLAAEPDLARELLRLSRQESLLRDVAVALPAKPIASPSPVLRPTFWSKIAMAASLLAFCTVLAVIFVPAPQSTPAAQDTASLIEKLRSSDVGDRDAALAELKKLPIAKLPALEKALDSDDAEVAGKVREAVQHILSSALSTRLTTFEIRATATAALIKKQKLEGYDTMELDAETLYVRAKPVIASTQVQSAATRKGEAAPMMSAAGGGAMVELAFTEEGRKTFDELAAQNYFQGVIIANGRVLQRITIGMGKDRALWSNARTKDAADALVSLLKGERVTYLFRLVPDGGSAGADEAVTAAKAIVGEKAMTRAEKAVEVALLDPKSPDFVALWRAMRKIGWKLEPN